VKTRKKEIWSVVGLQVCRGFLLILIRFVDTNCWSNFYVGGNGVPDNTNNLVIWEDLLIAIGQDGNQLVMASLNLQSNFL